MVECTQGVEVRRVWSEQEMVCTFGGQISPGTPDGMFESWDGTLTCVQVVRVPLTLEMSDESLTAALGQTIVTKVVKSQHWLRATHVAASDFVIFCWLPFSISETVAMCAEELMQRVQKQDSRFSLKLRVPAEAGALFPARFATGHFAHGKSYLESDVSTYSGEESSDEEECLWDITWSWESEFAISEFSSEASENGLVDESLVHNNTEDELVLTGRVCTRDTCNFRSSPGTGELMQSRVWDGGG